MSKRMKRRIRVRARPRRCLWTVRSSWSRLVCSLGRKSWALGCLWFAWWGRRCIFCVLELWEGCCRKWATWIGSSRRIGAGWFWCRRPLRLDRCCSSRLGSLVGSLWCSLFGRIKVFCLGFRLMVIFLVWLSLCGIWLFGCCCWWWWWWCFVWPVGFVFLAAESGRFRIGTLWLWRRIGIDSIEWNFNF